MKTLFKSLFIFAAAAAALVSCSKETAPSQTSGVKTIKFTVSTDDTKTSFTELTAGKYPTIWEEGDEVKVIANFEKFAEATVTPSEDGKKATFSTEVDTPSSKPYVLSLMCPSSAYIRVSTSNSTVTVQFPASQEPSEASVDPAAQIIGGTKDCGSSIPEEVDITFKHLSAYALVSFSNLNLGTATISSVNITSDAYIAGRFNWKPADNSFTVNAGSSTVSVATSSSTGIWVAVAPATVTSLKFVVNTDKGTFTKEVSVSKSFVSGQVAKINVNMAGIPLVSPVKYVKVTSAKDLSAKVGYEFVIAAATSDYAISTTQNGNNRAAAAAKKEGSYIINPADNVERFILEEGSSESSYSFYAQGTTSGYLYAASTSSNHLKTKAAKDETSSFTVAFDEEGVATVKSVSTSAKGWMQYNPNSGNPMFSCYAGTGTDREYLALYTLEGGSPVVKKSFGVDKNAISAAADETSATFNVTGNVDWTVSCPTGVTASPASGTGAATVTLSFSKNTESTQKKYEITVSTEDAKIATKTQKVTLTQAAAGLTGIAAINAALSTSTSKSSPASFDVQLTDAIVTFVNGNNFYIEDANAAVYVYGVSGHGLVAGDKLNGQVTGTGYTFNGLPEAITFVYTSATKTSGATIPLTTITIANLIADYTSYMSKRIKIEAASITDGISGTDRDGKATQAGSEIALRAQVTNVISVTSGVTADVIAFPALYNTTKQLAVWSNDNFIISPTGPNVISGFPETKKVSVGSPWTIGATCLSGDVTYNITAGGTYATLADGVLTPVSAGTVTLTATSPAVGDYTSQTLTCTVTVTEDLVFKVNFNSTAAYPTEFPTGSGTAASTPTTIAFKDTGSTTRNIVIYAPTAYYQINYNSDAKRALFFGKTSSTFASSAYLEFPAMEGYKLTSVIATTSSGVAGSVAVNIFASDGTAMSTAVNTTGSTEKALEFSLKDPVANTAYRLSSLTNGKNLQFFSVELTYEKVK